MSMIGPARPDDERLKELLGQARTIAVVGLSPKPERDSHRVAAYLQRAGYRVIPVNPVAPEVLGEKSYPDLTSIPEPVDIVDVFRQSRFVPEIAGQAVKIGAKVLWLQEGIVHDEAALKSKQAGLEVIQDACLMVEHRRLLG